MLKKIVEIQIDRMKKYLKERNVEIELSEQAKELLAERGFDVVYGARPLKRAIQKEILNPLARRLLDGTFSSGDVIFIDVRDDALIFSRKERAEATDIPA
jgi:ATP-dependent Clp protease ATP-binding subunit ClpB